MSKRTLCIFSLIAFASILFAQIFTSTQRNNGEFIYPIDDTYIHMAIADNFSEYGVWGIDRYEFSSTSSSLLYGGLLSGSFYILGSTSIIPLVLNILFSILVLIMFYRIAKTEALHASSYIWCIVVLIFFVPLPSMALSGMEHVLHGLLAVLLSLLAVKSILNKKDSYLSLLIFSFLVGAVRYEGLFLIGIVSFLLLVNKKYKGSLLVILVGIAPVIIFGIISVLQGSHFLPNTILAKSDASSISDGLFSSFFLNTFYNFFYHISRLFLTVPILISGLLVYTTRKKKNFTFYFSLITLLLFLSHCAFAKVGRFARYEAYLMIMIASCILYGTSYLKLIFNRVTKNYFIYVSLIMVLLAPAIKRAFKNYNRSIQASHNIYEQQVQMAGLIKQMPDATVMANDIGAVAYFNSNINIVDMVGLGSIDVLNMIRNSANKDELKNGYAAIANENLADLAIIYDHWFQNQIPDQWELLEKWTIRNNVICGHKTVSLYSLKPSITNQLKYQIATYQLPGSVIRTKSR